MGIDTTLRVLADTDTESSGRLLAIAIGSSDSAVREAAITRTLERKNQAGLREILRRWRSLDDRALELVRQHADAMTNVVREAVTGDDPHLCPNGCRAALWLQRYEAIPTLLATLGNALDPNHDMRAQTLVDLAERLRRELTLGYEQDLSRALQAARQKAICDLEPFVRQFARHRCRAAVEAFLILADRDNAAIKQTLQDAANPGHPPVAETLVESKRNAVIELVLDFLDDPQVPDALLGAAGRRADGPFVRALAKRFDRAPSEAMVRNLAKIKKLGWADAPFSFFDSWDAPTQRGAVQAAEASGIEREQSFRILAMFLRNGKADARVAAAEALTRYSGEQADELARQAMEDAEPGVQAVAATQARRRRLKSAVPQLIALLDSPHLVVRQTARRNLGEYTFARFLAAFDSLDESSRRTNGALVRKVDPQTVTLLLGELRSTAASRRSRALAMVRATETADSFESEITGLMQDPDPRVRSEALMTLANLSSDSKESSLVHAFEQRETQRTRIR